MPDVLVFFSIMTTIVPHGIVSIFYCLILRWTLRANELVHSEQKKKKIENCSLCRLDLFLARLVFFFFSLI